MDFLKEIVKEIGDEYTQIASDIDETERFIDTGSYIFNGLISGSILGGVSSNRITAIAGESSTGKTYFSLAVVKNFLDTNPDGYCLYFDTEAAVNKGLLESRGIDTTRLVVVNVVTIEEFRHKRKIEMVKSKKASTKKAVGGKGKGGGKHQGIHMKLGMKFPVGRLKRHLKLSKSS